MSSPSSPLHELSSERNTSTSANSTSAKDRKRRRIYRACDYCRLRKSRCDGKMPCTGCKAIDHECSYSDSLRSRRGGPRYIEELEGKIRSLEHALQTVNAEERIENAHVRALLVEQLKDAGGPWNSKSSEYLSRSSENSPTKVVDELPEEGEELLETMIEATGILNIDIVATESEYRAQMLPAAYTGSRPESFVRSSPLPPDSPHFSHPQLGISPNFSSGSYVTSLPPKKTAMFFIDVALNHPCCLMNFVHRPTLNELLEEVYEDSDMPMGSQTATALIYGFSAIGALFSGSHFGADSEECTPPGYQYFQTCQTMIDPLACNDIVTMQALICAILYMQGTGMVTRSYSTICAATSAAVRMGLHRASPPSSLDAIQLELRKRVFWVLRTMDTYVTSMLGFPRTLGEENVDQEMPIALEDHFITTSGIIAEGQSSSIQSNMGPVNAHTRLIKIMAQTLRQIYPSKRPSSSVNFAYGVSPTSVSQIESELEQWFEDLSRSDNTSVPSSSFEIRTQLLLRMAYGHVQMVLYRPFLHHILKPRSEGNIQLRSYACASACIKAAMQIVWLAEELDSRGLIHEAYWFTSYITSFAVTTLYLFITTARDDPTREETRHTAERGRAIVYKLAKSNPMADWCLSSLNASPFLQDQEFYFNPPS
ncbi:hypothetical protein EJ05DRAFT_190961 [Pseudovirgaria hyperparasitica]|uniref:Zn(2)-C6 fungal-type domain-containing protein n=1 Tax=Pseudovirgaria hyperparasitica TaxID=470096 RepID=A0A6A6WJZ2_9PEZI|nr:uncharacterized protein EJ05DRAFT_190961 [Pseudovirgaria hyperparasitica]KAF2761961.1 hypothetical protein EJ05DRAFT_190961 [Pseudovirgaria hyperparasitica]